VNGAAKLLKWAMKSDHNKMGLRAPAVVVPLREIHTIITDSLISAQAIDQLQACGPRVEVVRRENP
jgi:DeoR/GlpR family transcriptional regulator of sugar metabolism